MIMSSSSIASNCRKYLPRYARSHRRPLRTSSSSNSVPCIVPNRYPYHYHNENDNDESIRMRGRREEIRYFSSVSEAEVSKFSELSKDWWDPSKNPLIGMNSMRVEYIINELQVQQTSSKSKDDFCSSAPKLLGLSALDVGCGGGLLSESLARLGADVTAVDPSHTLVEHAKRHAEMDPKTRSIDYRGGCSIEQLVQEKNQEPCYDIICILEVLEHVTDVESILTSARSLLKPDTGRLFVSTLNRTIKSQLMAIIGAEYVLGILPPGTHDWNQFKSPQEVEELMNQSGLQQVDVQGLVITKPPFWGQWDWKLDPMDTDVNWIGTYKTK